MRTGDPEELPIATPSHAIVDMPGPPTLVEIRKLSKYYRRGEQIIPVLVDINLDVELGDYVALMGPSG